jgi:hypothetical protein
MIRSHRRSGPGAMSFSWGYIWQKWRATLQVEPLFLETAGSLNRASLPAGSQPGGPFEGNGAPIEHSSASGAAIPDVPKPPPSR